LRAQSPPLEEDHHCDFIVHLDRIWNAETLLCGSLELIGKPKPTTNGQLF